MRVFVTYKSQDIEQVESLIKELRKVSPKIEISYIRNSWNWKKLARDLIKKSDCVLYLIGHNFSEYIDWEINEALRLGYCVYSYKLYEDVELPDSLYINDEYGDKSKHLKIEYPMSLEELKDKLNGDRAYIRNKLFSNRIDNDENLLEQYKIMLSTSENLIERRQKLTTIFLSIFTALLPVLTFMVKSEETEWKIGSALISLICCMLCISWRNAIIAYGNSNAAKFVILEELEKCLPTSMFASEWMALKQNKKQFKSFTSRETAIPILFFTVYLIFLVISILMCFV